jgi:hypothetical protein
MSAIAPADETRFIEVPVGTKFKQTVICSVQEGNHLVNEPPMAPDEPVFQLLHTAVSIRCPAAAASSMMR